MSDRGIPHQAGPTFKTASVLRTGRRVVRYTLILVTIVLVIDAVVGEKGLLALLKAGREYHAVEVALDRARAENAALREEARRLREDPAAIEELARRELGLIKPGEKLFIIRDVQPKK
ncbi:MAG: septum formation initiator family protein [Acidobacteria bacterium]|nr:septum formation initiator family protein [Acidobacteriota bacterium]